MNKIFVLALVFSSASADCDVSFIKSLHVVSSDNSSLLNFFFDLVEQVFGCPWPDTCEGKTCCPTDSPVICQDVQACCPAGTYCDGNYCTPTFMTYQNEGKKDVERTAPSFKNATATGTTCTGAGEFCCGAPAGDVNNCPNSARTDDCDAKNDCCCG